VLVGESGWWLSKPLQLCIMSRNFTLSERECQEGTQWSVCQGCCCCDFVSIALPLYAVALYA
jgi:hypothetical protein